MNRFCQLLVALAASCMVTTTFAQADEPDIDPQVMAALSQMGTYLRSIEAFRVKVTTANDTVLEDGQKLQYEGNVDILARPPNRLRIHTFNDQNERRFFFDGKTFTLWGQRTDYYATVDAPGTIRELVDFLQEKHDIDTPGLDLFRWGTDEADTAAIQLWVQKGNYPLPRKLVITTKTDDARPQHTAAYSWDLAPSFNDAAFTFDPPKGALRVVLEKSLSSDDANE